MFIAVLPRIPALVLLTSCLLFAQQQSTPPLPPQTDTPAQGQAAQEQPKNPSPPPATNEPAQSSPTQPPTTQPRASESGQQAPATPKGRKNPKVEAWDILDDACTGNKTITLAMAIPVLSLMPTDSQPLPLTDKTPAAPNTHGRP